MSDPRAREFVEKHLGCDDIHGIERPLTDLIAEVREEERKAGNEYHGQVLADALAKQDAEVRRVKVRRVIREERTECCGDNTVICGWCEACDTLLRRLGDLKRIEEKREAGARP